MMMHTVSKELLSAIKEKADDSQLKEVRELAILSHNGSRHGTIRAIDALIEADLIKDHAQFTICQITRGSVDITFVFAMDSQQVMEKIAAIPPKIHGTTGRKTLVKMAVSRFIKLNGLIRSHNEIVQQWDVQIAAGSFYRPTEVKFEDLGFHHIESYIINECQKTWDPLLKTNWYDTEKFLKDFNRFLKREDVTLDILKEAWKIFEVERVLAE